MTCRKQWNVWVLHVKRCTKSVQNSECPLDHEMPAAGEFHLRVFSWVFNLFVHAEGIDMREILHHSISYSCIVTNMTSSLVLLFDSMYCFFSAQDTWTMFLQYFLCTRWTNLWPQEIVPFSSLARQECTFGDICGELHWAFWPFGLQ